MTKQNTRRALLGCLVLTLVIVIPIGIWIVRLDQNIKSRFAEKRFAPPVEFYSAPDQIEAGMALPKGFFETTLARRNFRKREFGQPIQPGDYSLWTADQCASMIQPGELPIFRCVAFRNRPPVANPVRPTRDPDVQIVAFDAENRVSATYSGANPQPVPSIELEPELFAQYYGSTPVLRTIVSLGSVPTLCLNGLLAIEDAGFLEHPGVSLTGLLRAVLTTLKPGQRAQGGSTITQQLVKNYFLTDERTLKRKATEMVMAFLVENRATKDEILETYINLIYMGQNGPFQVRGLAAASEHYFAKPLEELNLQECALLVGVLNNPGYFNPFNAPERALKRRARVLERMRELEMITPEQAEQAKTEPLPARPKRGLTEPAPYFVQSVRKVLEARGIDESEGLRVFTTLNLRAQEAAHQAIRKGLDQIEANQPHVQKLKAQGRSLEASLIAADPRNGSIQALVGGRGYVLTQFNRAVDAKRQIGSIMKPFVFLAALEHDAPSGEPYNPLSLVDDKSTTHRYDRKSWTPRNYDGKYNGPIPLYWALKESLNAATANLGIESGLENIVDVSRRLGVSARLDAVPALTLGAFELAPVEVLQAYSTLANLGIKVELTLINRVENLQGDTVYQYNPEPERAVEAEPTSELVGMMKQTLLSGTGRGARLSGFSHPAAGKTGTTNDKKDAWFAGFTPRHVAVVWVGYDDNTSHKLTGASGAVPLWTAYMKNYAGVFAPTDFPWPETVERRVLTVDEQRESGAPLRPDEQNEEIELIFAK